MQGGRSCPRSPEFSEGPMTRGVAVLGWARVVQATIIVLGVACYPFGPRVLRLAWHATHRANVSYAGVCVPIPGEWFVYHSHSKLIIIKAEAVLARNMLDIGYVYIDAPVVIVPFEKYKETLRRRENSEVFSHGGLEFACTDWDEPPSGFVNSCLVQDKMDINFAGPRRYLPDFRDLVHGMTACPAGKSAKSTEIRGAEGVPES